MPIIEILPVHPTFSQQYTSVTCMGDQQRGIESAKG